MCGRIGLDIQPQSVTCSVEEAAMQFVTCKTQLEVAAQSITCETGLKVAVQFVPAKHDKHDSATPEPGLGLR